ncbi:MAG: alpha/beta hydrolase [Acidimicrobiales bacterium]
MNPLAPGVEERIAHLWGATLDDVLAGRLDTPTFTTEPVDGVTAEDRHLPDGRRLARRYEPTASVPGPAPGIVWVHGGAWVSGDLDMPEADAVARRLASWCGAVVWSVDYRLAPTHTHPAAVDDVTTVLEWAAADPAVDPERLHLGGASAGAHLAAAAVAGAPPLASLTLAYPAIDPIDGPYGTDRPDACPELLWFDRSVVAGAFSLYLGTATAAPAIPRRALPLHGDLSVWPPTLVTLSTLDALAPQGELVAERLNAAGVPVVVDRHDDLLHGFLDQCGDVPAADAALRRVAYFLDEGRLEKHP